MHGRYMHSISEVIILNNDQHQHKKTATTNNRINSKIKQQHTTFVDWCYCLREVLIQKMFVSCLQVCLAWTTILLPNRPGEQTKTQAIFAGCACVEDDWEQLIQYATSHWDILHKTAAPQLFSLIVPLMMIPIGSFSAYPK